MLENILDSIPGYENSSLDTKYQLMLTRILPGYCYSSWLPLSFLVTRILHAHLQKPSCLPESFLVTSSSFLVTRILFGYQNPLWLPESFLDARILSSYQNPSWLPESMLITRTLPSWLPEFVVHLSTLLEITSYKHF